ncbi:MAG: GNAT family N-acetyltransferase [Anaerolineae bacterium]|nr:GNAT family N-acetyltransferase [Anaerolineae bacterium]
MADSSELTTTVVRGRAAFTQFAPQWDSLAHTGMTATPFQFLAYQEAWWTHLGPGELSTVAVYRDQDELIALAPFYNLDRVLYFNGCTQETDYLDLIVRSEQAAAAWEAVVNCLCTDVPGWDAIDLCNIPADSPTRTILPRLAASRGFSLSESIHEVCPVIPLPDSFEGYLETQLDKKQRHEVRRKLRRAEGAEARLVVVGPDDDIHLAVDQFLELLQKSTPEKQAWLNEGRRAVFHEVAAAAQADGSLQLMFMEMDGVKAAALFNFEYAGRVWVYNSGLDPFSFGHLSLGVVLTARAIELAIQRGNHTFDFLRGNEEYKYRFGAKDTTVHRIEMKRGGE